MRSGIVYEINSTCVSACVILAGLIAQIRPDLVCVGKNAVFGFHLGRFPRGSGWEYMTKGDLKYHYRQEVIDWVDEHGGWNESKMTTMYYSDLVNFYRPC